MQTHFAIGVIILILQYILHMHIYLPPSFWWGSGTGQPAGVDHIIDNGQELHNSCISRLSSVAKTTTLTDS